MKIKQGKGTTEYGPGVEIKLTGDEVATAIDAYLVARNVHVSGARTITVNGELCNKGRVYVDPSGFVINKGKKISGNGYNRVLLQSSISTALHNIKPTNNEDYNEEISRAINNILSKLNIEDYKIVCDYRNNNNFESDMIYFDIFIKNTGDKYHHIIKGIYCTLYHTIQYRVEEKSNLS